MSKLYIAPPKLWSEFQNAPQTNNRAFKPLNYFPCSFCALHSFWTLKLTENGLLVQLLKTNIFFYRRVKKKEEKIRERERERENTRELDQKAEKAQDIASFSSFFFALSWGKY